MVGDARGDVLRGGEGGGARPPARRRDDRVAVEQPGAPVDVLADHAAVLRGALDGGAHVRRRQARRGLEGKCHRARDERRRHRGPAVDRVAGRRRKMPSEWFEAAGGAECSAAAPTVSACTAAAGDPTVVWLSPELPAATTTVLPLVATALLTVWLIESIPSEAVEVPRLIEMTRTLDRLAHQSIPALIALAVPEPRKLSALATDRLAPGATPAYLAALGLPVPSPTAIDATWVPCPWSS